MKLWTQIRKVFLAKCIFFAVFLAAGELIAQEAPVLQREKALWVDTDTLVIDSLSVYPEGLAIFRMDGTPLDSTEYHLSLDLNAIIFEEIPMDSMRFVYQVLPYNLSAPFRRKPISLYQQGKVDTDPKRYRLGEDQDAFIPFQGLTRSGSISRGVRLGNNQDPVLNSSLDLQLSGDLGDNTTIRASITDNSLPVQADGNTRQLREFDRVFIEIENDRFGTLTAGDYNIGSQDNYFLNFEKRISGGGLKSTQKLNEKGTKLHTEVNGALARGKFGRNTFMGQEGNQGPYKIIGNDSELFVIIISGSERVYIDGILMERGQDNDYVIDYNAGELTFTALQQITKERRVVIEFQYLEQNYLRSVFYGNVGVEDDKWNVNFSMFSEQDAPNQPLFQNLSDDQQRRLSEIGDNIEDAFFPSFREEEFSADRVLYRMVDTLGFDSVFVYSTDQNAQLFGVSFSEVGQGRGDYVVDRNLANGRVFRWVQPINGVQQGNYAPIIRLVTPKQLQIATLSGSYQWNDNNVVQMEMATSRNDVNRFSRETGDDELGSAIRFTYKNRAQIGKWKMQSETGLEWVESSFTTVERLRNVEFQRDWNIVGQDTADQVLGKLGFSFRRDSIGELGYQLQFFDNGPFSGIRHTLFSQIDANRNLVMVNASALNTTDPIGNSAFYRQRSNIGRMWVPGVWSGFRSDMEWNSREREGGDIIDGSYAFVDGTIYTGIGDSTANFLEVFAFRRTDDTARAGIMEQNSLAVGYGVRGKARIGKGADISARFTDRRLKFFVPEETPWMQTVTGRVRYNQRLLSNAVNFTTFYEVGSGAEPRRIFSYVEVPAGTGTHVWNDYNENGIQELDEFEPARFPGEANFIRIFTPTNEFVRTNINKFSQMLLINPLTVWGGKEDFRKTLSRFSIQGTFQTDRRSLLEGSGNRLNPFYEPGADTAVIAMIDNYRGSLFFNRSETKFGGDYTYQQSQSRNLLSFGVEVSQNEEHQINLRMRIPDEVLTRLRIKTGRRDNRSANFESRNFGFNYYGFSPETTYQPSSSFRLTASYDWQDKTSFAEFSERVLLQNIGLEGNYNVASKTSVNLRLNFIRNDFEGNPNSPLAFEMLEGLRPGNNGVWALTLQRTLGGGMQLSLTYEGRASADIPVIHVGQVQVKAFF